MNRVII